MSTTRPEDRVSSAECAAWRTLYDSGGEYTHGMLSFMFEVQDETIARHVNGDCDCWELDGGGSADAQEKYTDEQLMSAYRLVKEIQPYQRMSQSVYDKHKPEAFPCSDTIIRRFGSWTAFREAVEA